MKTALRTLAVTAAMLGLSACATAPAASPPPIVLPDGFADYVVERQAVVRVDANGGAGEVGRLTPGERVTARVETAGDNWYRLTTPGGNTGYVFGLPFRPAAL